MLSVGGRGSSIAVLLIREAVSATINTYVPSRVVDRVAVMLTEPIQLGSSILPMLCVIVTDGTIRTPLVTVISSVEINCGRFMVEEVRLSMLFSYILGSFVGCRPSLVGRQTSVRQVMVSVQLTQSLSARQVLAIHHQIQTARQITLSFHQQINLTVEWLERQTTQS